MDRRIDAMSIKSIKGGLGGLQVMDLSLADRQIVGLKSSILTSEDIPSFKSRLQKYPEKVAIIFPSQEAYLHEVDIPCSVPRRSVSKILRSNSDAALPMLNASYKCAILTREDKETKHFLQFIIPKDRLGFCDEIERGIIAVHPSAKFLGMSELFHFPKDQHCLLLEEGDDHVEITWGMNNQIAGMRVIRKLKTQTWLDIFKCTLDGIPKIENLYSWCNSPMEKEIEKMNLKWIHLRSVELPDPIKGHQENMDMIVTALAHALGCPSEHADINFSGDAIFTQLGLRKKMSMALMLLLLLGSVYEVLGLVQLKTSYAYQEMLDKKVKGIVYQFLKEGTPLLDPVKQIQEKIGVAGPLKGHILSRQFLEILMRLYKKKPDAIDVLRVSFEGGQLYLEGESSVLEAIHTWVAEIQQVESHEVALRKVEQHKEEGLFSFQIVIHL